MLDKILENLIDMKPPRQLSHASSINNRSRDYARQPMPDLLIKKARSQQCQVSRLLISMWETESTIQMFDYENKTIRVKQQKLQNNHDVYISNMDKRYAKCIITKGMCPNDNVYCGNIMKSKGMYYYTPGGKVQCYKVIGSKVGQQYVIKTGDLIRIGRMKYFIKQTFDGFNLKFKDFQRNQNSKQLVIQSLKSGSCKFCLCDEKDNPDILISPCNCKGSCAQVHLDCLKQWLSNKVTRKSTSCVQFLNYDNFSCQICKEELPTVMRIDGKSYNMLSQNNKSVDPYIVLQGIPNEKSSTNNNLTITIKFKEKNTLIIGRGHEADVKLQDVSISRQHCFMKYNKGNFEIIDNNSKFGTLVRVQPNQKICLNDNRIQVSRMTLQLVKNQKMPQKQYGQFGLHEARKRY